MTELHKTLLQDFSNLANSLAKVINAKFVKVQELCSKLNPEKEYDYYLQFLNDEEQVVFSATPYLNEDNKWVVDFQYEDTCCSNALPCEDFKDSIIGMTVGDIQRIFSADTVIIYDTSGEKWSKIIEKGYDSIPQTQ